MRSGFVRRATTLGLLALLTASLLCFGLGGSGTPKARADTTDIVVIGCELIANAVDGNVANVITSLDVQAACGGDALGTHVPGYGTELPSGSSLANCNPGTYTGPCAGRINIPGTRSIKSLANAIGNKDGVLQSSDFRMGDQYDESLDANQLSENCTHAGAARDAFDAGLACSLDVFVFVNREDSVELNLPFGLKSVESQSSVATSGGGVSPDFICRRDDRLNEGKVGEIVGSGHAASAQPTPITAASGANPAVITSQGHGLVTGDSVSISGNAGTAFIDGFWMVTVLTADTFTIPANTLGGTLAGAPVVQKTTPVLIDSKLTTSTDMGLGAGDVVTITGSQGGENGQWLVTTSSGASVTLSGFINTELLFPFDPRVADGMIADQGTIVRDWAVGSDNDCHGVALPVTDGVPNNGDGVVMFHVLEDTASRGDVKTIEVIQDAVGWISDLNVVGVGNQVSLSLAESTIEPNATTAAVATCQTQTPYNDGVAHPNSTVARAVVTDTDNTLLTRVPVSFSITPPSTANRAKVAVGDPNLDIVSNTFWTIHLGGGAPTEAHAVICGGATPGSTMVDAAVSAITCTTSGCTRTFNAIHDSKPLTVGSVIPPPPSPGMIALSRYLCSTIGFAIFNATPIACEGATTMDTNLVGFARAAGIDHDDTVDPVDFASLDVDGDQLHEKDGQLLVIAFVDHAASAAITVTNGIIKDQSGVLRGQSWTCGLTGSFQFGDDSDCIPGSPSTNGAIVFGVIPDPNGQRGPGTISLMQDQTTFNLNFTVVGEVDHIAFVTDPAALRTGADGGIIDPDASPPGRTRPLRTASQGDDCAVPAYAPPAVTNGMPSQALVLVRAFDSDNRPIAGAFIRWQSDNPEIGTIARSIDSTIDLGPLGLGAWNVLCGTAGPGSFTVTAQTLRTQFPNGNGAFLDPSAGIASATQTSTVTVTSDTDGDGCLDLKESGAEWHAGGQRDPYDPWDIFDVPVPALVPSATTSARNQFVTLADVLAVLQYVGTTAASPNTANANGESYGSDINANGIPDGREYDRSPGSAPGQFWRTGPPNGVVSLVDVLAALAQVGTNCS